MRKPGSEFVDTFLVRVHMMAPSRTQTITGMTIYLLLFCLMQDVNRITITLNSQKMALFCSTRCSNQLKWQT